jgi:hypothetical protein
MVPPARRPYLNIRRFTTLYQMAQGLFSDPIPADAVVTGYYDEERNASGGGLRPHMGTDIQWGGGAGMTNSWVVAPFDGTIRRYNDGCNGVQVVDDSGRVVGLLHMANIQVRDGQRVSVGDALGTVSNVGVWNTVINEDGTTYRVPGAIHLHVEVGWQPEDGSTVSWLDPQAWKQVSDIIDSLSQLTLFPNPLQDLDPYWWLNPAIDSRVSEEGSLGLSGGDPSGWGDPGGLVAAAFGSEGLGDSGPGTGNGGSDGGGGEGGPGGSSGGEAPGDGGSMSGPGAGFGAAGAGADPPPPPDPLVLDLNGDGIKTTNVKAGAFFDHDGNGFAEQTGWVDPHDGLLVMDRNRDGIINDGRELFSTNTILQNGTRAANGFQALAELDSNHDEEGVKSPLGSCQATFRSIAFHCCVKSRLAPMRPL